MVREAHRGEREKERSGRGEEMRDVRGEESQELMRMWWDGGGHEKKSCWKNKDGRKKSHDGIYSSHHTPLRRGQDGEKSQENYLY